MFDIKDNGTLRDAYALLMFICKFRSKRTRKRKDLTMTAHTYNAPTISAGTIARTACLLLALTNQVLSACGKPMLPIESQTVEQLVTAGITTVAALVAWWKNNSFTPAALQADQTYDKLKAQGK